MPAGTLAEKLKLKPSLNAAVLNAPTGHISQLSPPRDVKIVTRLVSGPFDWLKIFVLSSADLKKMAPKIITALKPTALLWIA